MCLHWHDEEHEGKDFTKFLTQMSSQCVLKLVEKKWKTFKTSSKQMAMASKKSNFSDLILSKDEKGLFILIFLVGIIIHHYFCL